MENPIIVPFDLNTARKIKSGEIEGSVKYGWDNPIGEDSGRERKYDSQY